MATETLTKSQKTQSLATNDNQTEFFLRRLHSLAGIVPLGLFLVFHLSANNAALQGPESFNFVIKFLRSLPHVELIEIFILATPFLFHGLYGLIITPAFVRSKLSTYSTERNWAYYFQRITGIVLFVFIAVHVWHFKFDEDLSYNTVASSLQKPYWAITYAVGVIAAVYHFANGLWNFLISWGITIGKKSQRLSAIVCGIIGFSLLGLGLSALAAFYTADVVPAYEDIPLSLVEQQLTEQQPEAVQLPLDDAIHSNNTTN